MKPNAELAWRVLDHIDAHPEQWDQGLYIGKTECGTVACFAGWTVLLSGEKAEELKPGRNTILLADENTRIPDRAEELLGARWADEGTDYEHDLFHEYNTRDDLGRLVAEIFGPRPAATS